MIAAAVPPSGCYRTSVRRLQRLGSLLPWLALFVAAIVLRAVRFGLVFVDSGVRFPHGADELYHLRRIWFTVVNFPASLSFDSYLNHPEGAAPVWPPLFDWSIAAVARLLVGAADQAAVERVAVWAPPLIGAVAVLAAAWLARRTFSVAAGWLTGGLLAVLPAHVFYSTLGEVDHHVAVGLFATVLLAAAMRLVGPFGPARWSGPLGPEEGRPRGVGATGMAVAAALLLWPGFLLHILVVQAVLVLQVLWEERQEVARARARALALMHAIAALLLAPFCAGKSWEQYGSVSPIVLSSFQPLWLGAGALALGLAALLWSWPRLGGDRSRRIGSALALAAVGFAAAWGVVPGLPAALENAAGWFEADPFLGIIAELEPLLSRDGSFDAAVAHDSFSYLFWAYPFALLGLGWQAARARRGEVLLLLAWSLAFGLATLFQQRFSDTFAAGFALVLAPALSEGLRVARTRSIPRAALAGAALLAALLALSPYLPAYWGDLSVSLAARRGERLLYSPEVRHRLVLERVGRWLRAETPPTAGYLDPTQQPEYGVLCAWGHGHQLRYIAERPMVQDNFGPWGGIRGFERARAYYASREEEGALAIARELGARYVVAAPQGSGQRRPARGSLATRLALGRDREGMLAFRGGAENALAHHRLVFVADDAALPRAGEPPWTLAVYEIVTAARVVGSAPAGSRVSFELELRLPQPLRYRASARADGAGRYEIMLPYPSEQPYTVRSGQQVAALRLAEADVREGRRVAGPSFAP